MSTTKRTTISSKTAISFFDPLNVYEDIKDELHKNIPLQKLHWNYPGRPLRTIDRLDVEFVEENATSVAAPKHQMLGFSSAPYFKMILIKCEDTETYRSTVRPIIKEWVANSINGARDPSEWIIIHYVPAGSKAFMGNRFKYGVFDKLRTDFNIDPKTDRCFQLRSEYATESERQDAWKSLINKVKEGILEAFSTRVELYEDEITKLLNEKDIEGWNFGKFFVMKEGLALAFEGMNLCDDALLLYDSLEEAFDNMNRKKSITSFSSKKLKSIGTPLLELQKKSEFRHNILLDDISLFDFQSYLFSRQAYLLLCIAQNAVSPSMSALKVGELFLRLRAFLTEMEATLVFYNQSIQSIAQWIFDVADEFQELCSETDGKMVKEVAEGRGEILLLRRKAVETIATTHGWKIEGGFKDVSLEEGVKLIVDNEFKFKNQELASYVQSAESFYSSYRSITESALTEFDLAERTRTKHRLVSQWALLEYQLGNYAEAAKLLENVPALYSNQGWNLISSSLLLIYIQSLKHLERKNDILSNSLNLLSRSQYLSPEEISETIKNVDELSTSVSFTSQIDNYFRSNVDPYLKVKPGKDVYYVEVTIENNLKHEVEIELATLTIKNSLDSMDTISLTVKDSPILIGTNKTVLQFETPRMIKTNFRVTNLVFKKRKVHFVKTFSNPIVVQFHPFSGNFNASLCVPRVIDLSDRRIGLLIESGQNNIKLAKTSFKSMTTGLKLVSTKALNDTTVNPDVDISTQDGRPPIVVLENIQENSKTVVTIPYAVDSELTKFRIKAYVDYTTEDGESFHHALDQVIDVSLELSVNVQDFYKANKLFSKFTMSCTSEHPVRILNTSLESNGDFKISSPFGTSDAHVSSFFSLFLVFFC